MTHVFIDLRCRRCGRRYGRVGDDAEMAAAPTACPHCGCPAGAGGDEHQIAAGELDDLLGVESGLTGWEVEFVEDLHKRRGRRFSRRQIDKLHQIWDRVCG